MPREALARPSRPTVLLAALLRQLVDHSLRTVVSIILDVVYRAGLIEVPVIGKQFTTEGSIGGSVQNALGSGK